MTSPADSNPPNSVPSPEAQRMIDRFAGRFEELRTSLMNVQPDVLAARCGAVFDEASSRLHIQLWRAPVTVAIPGYVVFSGAGSQPASLLDQAFIFYYLNTADGAALENRWIAFSELPDGRFYTQAFQGYTGSELARRFSANPTAFDQAAERLGGRRVAHGDSAFTFQALPRAPIMAVCWHGDEDFPSTFQLLFDAAARHYLPTDAYAILGSTLTRRLIRTAAE